MKVQSILLISSKNIRQDEQDKQDKISVPQKHLSKPPAGNILHHEITERIIGCTYRVYNKMGFGFLESVYEKCLLIELQKSGLQAVSQEPITVYYDYGMAGSYLCRGL